MPISWIDHHGYKILFIDLKGASKEQMLQIVEEQKKVIDAAPAPVLLLNDFRDTIATQEYMDKAKQYGREQKEKIKKTALLGITGMKKVLVMAYIQFSGNKNTRVFDNIEEAKEYLIT